MDRCRWRAAPPPGCQRGISGGVQAAVVRRNRRLVGRAGGAEHHVDPVVGRAEGAGREQIAVAVSVDTVVACGRRQQAVDVGGREIVACGRVMAVAMEARHIGRAGGDRYRIAERHGLPAAGGLVGECRARQQGAGAAPQ